MGLFQNFMRKILFNFWAFIFLFLPLIVVFRKFITFFCHINLINTCFGIRKIVTTRKISETTRGYNALRLSEGKEKFNFNSSP